MINNLRIVSTLLFGSLIAASCGDGTVESTDSTHNQAPVIEEVQKVVFDKQKVNRLLDAVPSPMEFSYIILDLNLQFSPSVMNPVEHHAKYLSKFDKAINLGVYGTDLVYATVFQRSDVAQAYMEPIQSLIQDLGFDQHIDLGTLAGVEQAWTNGEDAAELFNGELQTLYRQNSKADQENLTALMVVGGWLESVYIATSLGVGLTEIDSPLLKTIYEEANVLADLILVVEAYGNLPGFEALKEQLVVLQKELDKVVENESNNGPYDVENNSVGDVSVVNVKDKSSSKMAFDLDNYNQLVEAIKNCRNEIIKL